MWLKVLEKHCAMIDKEETITASGLMNHVKGINVKSKPLTDVFM